MTLSLLQCARPKLGAGWPRTLGRAGRAAGTLAVLDRVTPVPPNRVPVHEICARKSPPVMTVVFE